MSPSLIPSIKRINFLHLLAEELGLSGVHFYHGRAEDFAQDKAFRAQFDIVTARAVARMQVLSELTIPYLKVGGTATALSRLAMLQKSWKKPKMPSTCSLVRLKTIYSMNCQMEIHAISLL